MPHLIPFACLAIAFDLPPPMLSFNAPAFAFASATLFYLFKSDLKYTFANQTIRLNGWKCRTRSRSDL